VDAGDTDSGLSMLPELAKKLVSIQMPLYLHAFWKATGREAVNGAFVCLGKGGDEAALFGADMDPDAATTAIQDKTPLLAGFILKMMLQTPRFSPQVSPGCAWCAWRQACPSGGEE